MHELQKHIYQELTASHSLREIWFKRGCSTWRSRRRISGISVHNSGGYPTARNYLVVVDLSDGFQNARSTPVHIPKAGLAKHAASPGKVIVTRIEAVSPSKVRLYVPEETYGVKSIDVDIPGPISKKDVYVEPSDRLKQPEPVLLQKQS